MSASRPTYEKIDLALGNPDSGIVNRDSTFDED